MLLDIGTGTIIAIITSKIFILDLSFYLVLVSIFFAVLPDLDYIFFALKKHSLGLNKHTHEHRDIFHHPLVYLLLGGIMTYWFGLEYLFIFATVSSLHFVHDSIGIGWGVKWLSPFSNKSYKFFSKKTIGFPRKIIVSWTPKELRSIIDESEDGNWFADVYLRPSSTLIIEILFLIISLIFLIYA